MRTRGIHIYLMCCAAVIGAVVWVGVTQARVRVPLDRDITVANLNILHGFACNRQAPGEGDQCRVKDRLALLIQHIIAVGCPDIITLQENVTSQFVFLPDPQNPTNVVPVGPLQDTVALIEAQLDDLKTACGFAYEVIFDPMARRGQPAVPALGRGIDEELILTRYPSLGFEVVPLYSPLAPAFFRHLLFARIDHPVEPIDVYTVHLAAEADFGDVLCRDVTFLPLPIQPVPCPTEDCEVSDTVRECQAKQMARFIEASHTIPGAGLITGDFNAPPSSNVYNEFAGRGWLDSHLLAKNAECNLDTGTNCTAGREDENLSDLESSALNQKERIDYIFVIPPDNRAARCEAVFDRPRDPDRDGTGTGLFASEPNPFGTECGAAPLPICWPSDHSGNQLDLNCQGDRKFRSLLHLLVFLHKGR